ncbi:hypothetical protein NP493_901g00026 [Ridgeia piscesae]|uniref:Uncharacterized protein n=1 Tax=Ridgeia piscesae TaxID=27915 RepID=A0AAD9KK75_RIDPI|nr:hypothetical protein NP493_901g00026 [Ridgeia piscesae]
MNALKWTLALLSCAWLWPRSLTLPQKTKRSRCLWKNAQILPDVPLIPDIPSDIVIIPDVRSADVLIPDDRLAPGTACGHGHIRRRRHRSFECNLMNALKLTFVILVFCVTLATFVEASEDEDENQILPDVTFIPDVRPPDVLIPDVRSAPVTAAQILPDVPLIPDLPSDIVIIPDVRSADVLIPDVRLAPGTAAQILPDVPLIPDLPYDIVIIPDVRSADVLIPDDRLAPGTAAHILPDVPLITDIPSDIVIIPDVRSADVLIPDDRLAPGTATVINLFGGNNSVTKLRLSNRYIATLHVSLITVKMVRGLRATVISKAVFPRSCAR